MQGCDDDEGKIEEHVGQKPDMDVEDMESRLIMFKNVMEGMPMAGVMLDRGGAIEFCNGHFLELTDWSHDEIHGKCWFDTFLPEGKRSEGKAEYHTAMKSGTMKNRFESSILTRAGKEIGIIWNCVILRDQVGNAVGTFKLGLDLPGIVHSSADLLRLWKYERIAHSTAALVHDLNNLLFMILGYSQMMAKDIPEHSPLSEYTKKICILIKKGKIFSGQLFSVIRGEESADMAELDLCKVLEECNDFLSSMQHGNVTMEARLESLTGIVMGNKEQIERLLMNLLTNARDAMPDGGNILIEISESITLVPILCHGSEAPPGKYVLLSFSDTGQGMDNETVSHIFEPFFTKRKSGIGIGLLNVIDIVKHHNAHIEVSSTPGCGTTFRIYFPMHSHGESDILEKCL